MAFGLDYTAGNVSLQCLKAAGAKFVCRYLAPPGIVYDWKRLTKAEVGRIGAANLGLVLVFEGTAGRARQGLRAGEADGMYAANSVISLGLPPDSPVYFAVDFDAKPGEQAAINQYLQGAASKIGKNRVGMYGSYYVVKRCLDAKACKYAWQTYAWSGGQWDSRAHLRQYANGKKL